MFCALASCEPVTQYRENILNQSDEELMIITYTKNSDLLWTERNRVIIKVGEEKSIFDTQGINFSGHLCNYPFWDSIHIAIINDHLLKVMINLKDKNNWSNSINGGKLKGYISLCKATIKNTDIVPK